MNSNNNTLKDGIKQVPAATTTKRKATDDNNDSSNLNKRKATTRNVVVSPSPVKKKKSPCSNNTHEEKSSICTFFDTASDELTSFFLSYLDVKSLYNFTFSTKRYMKLLRHEHVVRSALMHGGHANNTMKRLINLIHNETIYVPSPLRMLRLCNGKRCEYCNSSKVNVISEHYGTFHCFHWCVKYQFTKQILNNQKWSQYIYHKKIAQAMYSSKAYIWIRPYKDTTNENAGPLITKSHIEKLCMKHVTKVETIWENARKKDRNVQFSNKIIQVAKECETLAIRREVERQGKKRKANQDTNDKRKLMSQKMVDTLRTELINTYGCNKDAPSWIDAALEYRWRTYRKSVSVSIKVILQFECTITEEFMSEYINAPSKATKKKLKDLADKICNVFTSMEKVGFTDFSFLDETNSVECTLKHHCISKYNEKPFELFKNRFMHLDAVERFKTGGKRERINQLVDLLSCDSIIDNTGSIFAPLIIEKSMINIDSEYEDRAKSLAALFWSTLYEDKKSAKAACRACIEKFPTLYENVINFIQLPEMKQRKSESSDNHRAYQNQENKLWTTRDEMIKPLLSRDFNTVIDFLDERVDMGYDSDDDD